MTTPLDITTTAHESLTLFDLQRMVRSTLEARFAEPVWISAEVSELKLNRSGHCYLNLVEKGSTDGAPRAEARAVIWKSSYARLAPLFEQATGASLAAGIRLLVRVVVTYHEVYGFSLQIIDIDPSYTLGEVERRRRETIERLRRDGVWDMNREVELSCPTLRIAVLSSATAAGYRDFCREIARSPYAFRLTLFESLMQGDSAEQSIIDALERIAEEELSFDIVAIIRGGGSTSDLALFDSYRIASHIAQFPLPVITGIGHDKDVSVSDMVAHLSCKTPTAVATALVELADGEMYLLDSLAQQLGDLTRSLIAEQRVGLERRAGELSRQAIVALNNSSHSLEFLENQLVESARNLLTTERQRIALHTTFIESRSVANILALGFSVVRNEQGEVCRIEDVAQGDSLRIEIAGGSIRATVDETIKNEKQ